MLSKSKDKYFKLSSLYHANYRINNYKSNYNENVIPLSAIAFPDCSLDSVSRIITLTGIIWK